MNNIPDDCLREVLRFFCAHEIYRVYRVARRWAALGADEARRTTCKYRHDLVPNADRRDCVCCVHGLRDGALFTTTFQRMQREAGLTPPNIGSSTHRRTLYHPGTFVHFDSEEQRIRFFDDFVKRHLRVRVSLGGTCCTGKGVKVNAVIVQQHA